MWNIEITIASPIHDFQIVMDSPAIEIQVQIDKNIQSIGAELEYGGSSFVN